MRLLRAAPWLRAVSPAVLLLGLAAASGVTPRAAAQTALTAADYARAERMLAPSTFPLVSGTSVRPGWMSGGRFWYRGGDARSGMFYVVDPAKRTREPAFDHVRLARALSAASGTPVDAERLPFGAIDLDGDAVTVSAAGRRWTCRADTCTPAAATAATAPPMRTASRSPDGKTDAFIREHNLWARDVATGRETALTTDGIEDFGYATDNAGWTHSDRAILTWSPDSRRIATFQHDGRGVGRMHLVNTSVGTPRAETWAYPLPGDSVVFRISRVIVDLGTNNAAPRVVRLQMAPDFHRSTVSDHIACSGATLCDAQWTADGQRLVFVSSSRDHKTATVRVADAATGAVRDVLTETSATQIGDASLSEDLWRVLGATNEMIWWSQRAGWVHLSLVDLATGRVRNAITTGDGNVDEVVRVDEAARVVYFMGVGREAGRDPYFRHLYRVGFDGRGLTLLTPEDANHVVTLAPEGTDAFLDTYSTPDTPPVTVVRDLRGRLLHTVERADISRLTATGWRPPTPVRMKGRDGVTDIHGLMFTPTTLDPSRRYPVIDYIYPGPQSGSVGSRSFSPARGDNQALAELGFVVVAIDGMGTPGRSKAFHDAYYGRMGDNTLPDQIAGIRELATRYPYIDTSRVGIWGHSGGGFAAAAALLRHPGFFDVGIAESAP